MNSNKKLAKDLLKKLPKAELHCHLDGSLKISTIIELAKEQNIELPSYDENELRKIVTVTNDCPSLVEYLKGFEITLRVLQKRYAITRAVFEVAEDASKDGVKYLEIRFSPVLHTDEGLSLSQVMEAVCEGQAMAELSLPILVRIIVCGMRQLDPSVTEKLAEIAWRYRHKGVVGFDLAGPEDGYSSEQHKGAFNIVHSYSLHCTLHSGEAAGWESVRDSVRYCGAERIGHGVHLQDNPDLVQFVIDRRLTIEVCLTSNIQTKAIKNLNEHPLRSYFDNGMLVAICTDNPVVSGVLLSEEYALAQDQFDFTPTEMIRLIDYGFRSAFLPIYQKSRLRAEVLHQCIQLLFKEGYDVEQLILDTAHLGPSLSVPLLLSNTLDSKLSQHLVGIYKTKGLYPPSEPLLPHIGSNINPAITLDIIRRIPKTDLHCRLDGSISIDFIWEELQKEGENLEYKFPSKEDLRAHLQPRKHSEESNLAGRKIMRSVLQSKEQLARACDDICKHAADDHVTYMELMVAPFLHTEKGLKASEVVDTIVQRMKLIQSQLPITVGVVLYVTTKDVEPIPRAVAELVVKHKQDICGFGVFGSDVEDHIVDSEFEWCPDTIRYLKDSAINICIAAGRTGPQTIITALHDGGASRISGAFKLHQNPNLMSYLASRSIAVELGVTDAIHTHSSDISTFAHPIRLYLDSEIRVTICSFDDTLYSASRSQTLFKIVQDCNLTVAELIKLLTPGFRRNFQPYQKRLALFDHFWEVSKSVLQQNGFKYLNESRFFVKK